MTGFTRELVGLIVMLGGVVIMLGGVFSMWPGLFWEELDDLIAIIVGLICVEVGHYWFVT